MKRIFAALLAAVMLASLAACGGAAPGSQPASSPASGAAQSTPASEPASQPASEPAREDGTAPLRIAGLRGPTTMGLVNLLADAEPGAEENTYVATADGATYDFRLEGAADAIVPLLVQGRLDAAAIPANLAATLYQKTGGAVQAACVNTLGVLYMVELGSNIQSVADLKGATILSTGAGTTPEYVLRYVLAQNGIDPDNDVTIEYLSEAAEVAARLTEPTTSSGTIVAMLPQPYVTSVLAQSDGGVRVALDMTEEWGKVADGKLVTGVLVARTAAIEANPERFEQFLASYAASVAAAGSDLEGTAALCEQFGIVGKAALAQKALPACNIVFETGEEMKTDLSGYLQVLYDADPASVGGAMPDDAFYYGV